METKALRTEGGLTRWRYEGPYGRLMHYCDEHGRRIAEKRPRKEAGRPQGRWAYGSINGRHCGIMCMACRRPADLWIEWGDPNAGD